MDTYTSAGPGKLYCNICSVILYVYNPGVPTFNADSVAILAHQREYPDQHPPGR